MPWISDVAPQTTIRSQWGNSIRDRVVMTYANKAELLAQPAPVEGMLAVCLDTDIVYQRVGSQWWVLSMPPRAVPTDRLLAWWQNADVGGTWFVSMCSGGGAQWRQSMGWAEFYGTWQTNAAGINVDYYALFAAPIGMSYGAPIGQARVYSWQTGLAFGGWASWHDNGGQASNPSRNIIGNPGGTGGAGATNVGPWTRVRIPSGDTKVSFDVHVSFQCDPTIDTP